MLEVVTVVPNDWDDVLKAVVKPLMVRLVAHQDAYVVELMDASVIQNCFQESYQPEMHDDEVHYLFFPFVLIHFVNC